MTGEETAALTSHEIHKSYCPIALDHGHVRVRHKNGSLDGFDLKAYECQKQICEILQLRDQGDPDHIESMFYDLLKSGQQEHAWRLASKRSHTTWMDDLGLCPLMST